MSSIRGWESHTPVCVQGPHPRTWYVLHISIIKIKIIPTLYITIIILSNFCFFVGKVVAGYRVKNINKNEQKWDLLGKRDPMTPQMFYPIENNITVESGDILVSSF